MTAGYSSTPLIRKLGIRSGFAIRVVDPPADYWDLLGELPPEVDVIETDDAGAPIDFVHVFGTRPDRLAEAFARFRPRIAPDGMIWASWPKRASGVPSELDGNVVRELGLAAGLVDVKVCAVDETWSGLKFVIRVADR